MGSIEQRLAQHTMIGLDTSVFIYHFEANRRYLALTTAVLSAIQAGKCNGVISVSSVMELTVHPWKLGRREIAQQYETLLAYFPNLTLADVTRDVARQAAQLRAQHNLRPADALQVATGLVHQATAFITNDAQWKRLSSRLEIVVLEDFV